MKKNFSSILASVITLILVICLAACGNEAPENQTSESTQTEASVTSNSNIDKAGLWENAEYLSDTTLGEGEKSFNVEVEAEGKKVVFNVKTDKSTVGEALLENNLIAGDEGQYGLYVKVVNGITADYDENQSYWAFYIDGEYATTGVDGTEIIEGAVYQLVYSK